MWGITKVALPRSYEGYDRNEALISTFHGNNATFPEFHLNNLVLMYKAKCLKSYPSDHIDFLSPPVPGHLLCAISNPETVEIRSDHGIARISVSFQRTSLSLPKSILTTISHSEEHYLPKTALFQLRTV